MKVLALTLLFLLSGCAFTRYTDDRVTVWRVGLATDYSISRMSVTCSSNSTSLKVGSLINEADVKEMIEALKAAAVLIK
jgi:hypothetical protein